MTLDNLDEKLRDFRARVLKLREEGKKLDAEVEETLRKIDAIQETDRREQPPPSTQS